MYFIYLFHEVHSWWNNFFYKDGNKGYFWDAMKFYVDTACNTKHLDTWMFHCEPTVCKRFMEPQDSKSSIYFGDSQILGCGLARTFSIFKKDCLSKVGFVINEKAFQSLPTFTNSCVQSYKLALPFSEKVQELGIKFGEIDWHPLGQTQYASLGNGLLAFRLFFIDAFQTQQIVPLGPNCDTFVSNDPRLATPSTVLPTGFVPFPVATSVVESTTEEIGIRYLASSSIVPNAPFQQTLFFGVWNQSLTFLEPIVKKDQILNHKCEPFVSTIPQPSVLPHCKTFPVAWEYGYSDCLGGFYVVFHFE